MGKIYGFQTDGGGEYIYNGDALAGYDPVREIRKKRYPVPVKFWHCEDDNVVSCEITRAFVNTVTERGGSAFLRTFPQGGHEPQLVGEAVAHPAGNTQWGDRPLKITPAVEEVFLWIKDFDQ